MSSIMTMRELEDNLKILVRYGNEMIKREKIKQVLKTRVAEVVRSKKRAARKRAKIIQRRVHLAQEMAMLTGTTPAPIDPNLQLEFEYLMNYLKFDEPIINDLFRSLTEEELNILRPHLR